AGSRRCLLGGRVGSGGGGFSAEGLGGEPVARPGAAGDGGGTPPRDRAVWSPATDEAISSPPGMGMPTESEGASEHRRDSDAEPVVAGTLRTPRRWEELLVEAAVVGGKERWARRLDGLAAELRLKITGLEKVEPESPRLIALDRQLVNLEHLRRFALPIIEELAALPRHANWGEWLAALERLAPMALRHPERVL